MKAHKAKQGEKEESELTQRERMAHLQFGWSSGWMTILTFALFQQLIQQYFSTLGIHNSDFCEVEVYYYDVQKLCLKEEEVYAKLIFALKVNGNILTVWSTVKY